MKFIDLFAGLGGFHVALTNLGHNCVFASEIKPALQTLYETNFGKRPHGNIRFIKESDIPAHDILCAGFPCQPFSKAGRQKGMEDESNGDLFSEIVRILKYHKPRYFILENVQHLAKHDNEETYKHIESVLRDELGYSVQGQILSPHQFNIPQHRQRLFIVGSRVGLKQFTWPKPKVLSTDVFSYLETSPKTFTPLEPEKEHCLDVWQEFINSIPQQDKLPSFPIWAMEFGATYPFEEQTPFASSSRALGATRGTFGIPLLGMSREEKFLNLPSYARTEQNEFPGWKKHFIRSNREFYNRHKQNLKAVVKQIEKLNVPSWQKLEWNIQGGERTLRKYLIQFRGSGIRLKRADYFPSLVCVSTQIPILGWQSRYITKWEGAKIQGLKSLSALPDNIGSCFDALGNAVNADLVYLIAESLCGPAKLINETKEVSKRGVSKIVYESI
jgi:DNA (cytosine-5)-methyltransferase 1